MTGSGLDIAHSAVKEADSALESLESTMGGLTTSMSDAQPSLEAISDILGTELPNTIIATQDSLESAKTSAKNIDGLLTSLSKIPLLGALVYNPKVPLSDTIAGVADSLNEIPKDLINAQLGLDLTIESMDGINQELDNIAQSTARIRTSTDETLTVIENYQLMVDDLQQDVERIQRTLPRTLQWATAAAVVFLIWLGLAQIGLLLQGLELMRRVRLAPSDKPISDTSG